MRSINKLGILVFSGVLLTTSLVATVSSFDKKEQKVEAYTAVSTLPKKIYLKNSDESDVRSYYSNLNSLVDSQKRGTNLLKNLKPILKNNQKYFSYDSGNTIWQLYEIADRDWVKSPASALPSSYQYDSVDEVINNYVYGEDNTNKGCDPYVHALYINRNVENQTKAWGNHNQDMWGINREHVWPKSQGFDSSGAGGARGDPMHLMCGNGYSNNIHSNYFYGNVDQTKTYTNCGTKYSNQQGNLRGTSLTIGSGTVFEPQKDDKGDIARAIFYMVARYNYLSGSDSDGINSNNPNLELVQSSSYASSGYPSTTSKTGKMGVMSDLLAWNHDDPPDEYEIHRNNLLYRNFTNNRNPFIDFPEWADMIWGDNSGSADPTSDTMYAFNGGSAAVTGVSLNIESKTIAVNQELALNATVTPSNASDKSVAWTSSNSSVASVSDSGVVTGKAVGNTTITVRTTDGDFTATCAITVTNASPTVSGVTLSDESLNIDILEETEVTLLATVEGEYNPSQSVTWTTSDSSVATVDEGVVTILTTGTVTITATSVADNTKSASCEITIYDSSDTEAGTWDLDDTAYKEARFGASYNSKGVSSYTIEWSSTKDGFTVNIANANNNNNGWDYIKVGHKDYDSVATITTNEAIDKPIGRVTINISVSDATKVNSIKLYYADNSSFENASFLNFTVASGNQSVDIAKPTANLYYKIEFDCLKKTKGLITINSVDYYSSTFVPAEAEDVNVESVSLDIHEATIEAGAIQSLTQTVLPSDATDKSVSWNTSDNTVATVIEGVVTGVGIGTATITVVTTDGGYTDTCVITVIEATDIIFVASEQGYDNTKVISDFTIYSQNSDTITGTFSKSTGTTDPKYYDIGTAIRAYSNNTLTITSSKSNLLGITFTFGSGDGNNTISVNRGTYSNGVWSTTTATNSVTFTIGSSSGNHRRFAAITVNVYNANTFASEFLTTVTCDGGLTAPSTTNWGTMNTKWGTLFTAQQNILKGANGNISGNVVQQAIARYDLILSRYGDSSYTNYMERSINSIGKINLSVDLSDSGENMTVIIIVSSITILTLSYFLIRKKKLIEK